MLSIGRQHARAASIGSSWICFVSFVILFVVVMFCFVSFVILFVVVMFLMDRWICATGIQGGHDP